MSPAQRKERQNPLQRSPRSLEDLLGRLIETASKRSPIRIEQTEFGIDELAHRAGMKVRSVRLYRERGLLPPPRRVGRLALFNHTHLSRLQLISSMLDRGYSIANVHEMLTAWEEGRELSEVLGVENALIGSWSDDRPTTMPTAEVQRMVNDPQAFDRLVNMQLIAVAGTTATIARPKLLGAFCEMRDFGMSMDTVLDTHEKSAALIGELSRLLVYAGARQLEKHFDAVAMHSDGVATESLVTQLVRFRTLATTSVMSTLAASIDATIEPLLTSYFANLLEESSVHEAT